MDNLEVLQQNGFDIEVNEDENRDASVPRLALVGRPISKSTVFDMKGSQIYFVLIHSPTRFV